MRVVAGIAGGRRLQTPKGRRLRPTTERVREAVFSSLASMGAVEGARVVDLFAGSGALGIEALSRGAESAVFVDGDAAAVAAIRANLATTDLAGGKVVQADVGRFLLSNPAVYDLAFADPPYGFAQWPRLLESLRAGLAVLESRSEIDPGPGWKTVNTRRYGGTVVTFVRRQ